MLAESSSRIAENRAKETPLPNQVYHYTIFKESFLQLESSCEGNSEEVTGAGLDFLIENLSLNVAKNPFLLGTTASEGC